MSRTVKCGLIQAKHAGPTDVSIDEIKRANIEKHLGMIEDAAKQGVQILCMQEVFTTPYFCAEQKVRWYEAVEKIPDGPTTKLMQETAKKHNMVIIVPIYEEEITGIYYNTAAVIDADGKYLGKYRKHHIPHVNPGFWEKFYFKTGNLGFPAFDTAYAKVGVYICYDRHFPEGARALGLSGAEIVFNPSRPWPACLNTFGNLSSRLMRSPMDISSARSIAWAMKCPGTSASFMAKATSAIRADKSSHRRRAMKTRWS
jgi:N-carbamoylputrescine amidase